MAEQVKKQPAKKKKMGALGKFFISLLVIFIIIPCTLVGLTYALFYDASHKNIHVRENYPVQEVVNDIVVHSLDDTVVNERMDVRLTEDAINQVFYDVIQSAGSLAKTINNFYIEITNSQYIFVFELDFDGWFRTKAMFYTKLRIKDDVASFKIDNIKLGRVGRIEYLARLLALMKVVPDINKILANNGIHMTFSLFELEFRYPLESLASDLGNALGSEASKYATIVREMLLNKKFVELIPNSNKAIEADLLLYNMRPTSEFVHIDDYEMPNGYLNAIMEHAVSTTKTLLDTGIINPDHTQAVMNYYVRGYDHLDDQQKGIIDLYTGVIPEATDTYEYTIPADEYLDTIILDQINSYPPGASHIEAVVTTEQIDHDLSEADLIGQTMAFKSKNEDNIYTCNFITFDRLTNIVDAVNQSLFLTISLNLNGYDIGISFKTTLENTTQFGKAIFRVDGFYLGDEPLTEQAHEEYMELVGNAITNSAFCNTLSIETVDDASYLIFDISSILNGCGISESLGYVTSFEILPQTATTPGTLKFTADR